MVHFVDAATLKADNVNPHARLMELARVGEFENPTLLLDPEIARLNYRALREGLGKSIPIHYAVKANPAPAILSALAEEGCLFDAASRQEIETCLALGIRAESISFGNTIKKSADIAFAHTAGVNLFSADAEEELLKIAENAPGARVQIRLLIESTEADWPLSRKFGVAPDLIVPLYRRAAELGLKPSGLSFHVGSQTRRPEMWGDTLDRVEQVWRALLDAGIEPGVLNIGGGFPAEYDESVLAADEYARQVVREVRARFGDIPMMAEPGRSLVADAGVIAAEVLLVARKSKADIARWVYLDIGLFSGLAEAMDEMIRYRFLTHHDESAATGPCILAGPSCDSADVLYEKRPVSLPLELSSGDRIVIPSTGAYTYTYASVGFNGFPPLELQLV